jgi:hypothetical protein
MESRFRWPEFPKTASAFLRDLQSAGDVALPERHARQPWAQYRLRERNRLGSNGAVRERMHAISASFGACWQGRSRVIAS